jgi:hypothetical protein
MSLITLGFAETTISLPPVIPDNQEFYIDFITIPPSPIGGILNNQPNEDQYPPPPFSGEFL